MDEEVKLSACHNASVTERNGKTTCDVCAHECEIAGAPVAEDVADVQPESPETTPEETPEVVSESVAETPAEEVAPASQDEPTAPIADAPTDAVASDAPVDESSNGEAEGQATA